MKYIPKGGKMRGQKWRTFYKRLTQSLETDESSTGQFLDSAG